MSTTTIDAKKLSKLFLAGASNLESKKELINELNVFPVPDGDTGTNMTMTIMAAAKAVENVVPMNMEELCKAISGGSLRGARGNSGVILSQLLRGFTKTIRDSEEVNVKLLAEAFVRAKETAYKAVMKPKEGTILTVAREMAEKAEEIKKTAKSVEEFGEVVIKQGLDALDRTPEMLPVLKEAGVVDSGGRGLMEVVIGAFDYLTGKTTEIKINTDSATKTSSIQNKIDIPVDEIKFGYCTEFIILSKENFTSADELDLKNYLTDLGDSIVVVVDEDVVKVHVHTNDPGLAMQKGLTYGELTSMKIDNLREEHREVIFKQANKNNGNQEKEAAELKEYGFVTVSQGEGLTEIFKELGADEVITGGQTMNPSTDDIINAIESVNAKTVFVFPNNGNIVLAAEQAVELVEGKNVIVIPTKTVPQGITALVNFIPDASIEENKEAMLEGISYVKTGEVTYAVRDTQMDGIDIKKNDFMAITDGKLSNVGNKKNEVVMEMIHKMVDDESAIISIYYGEDTKEKDASKLAAKIEEEFEDLDVELHFGGQAVYYYIISVE